jgi:hypothetical protein
MLLTWSDSEAIMKAIFCVVVLVVTHLIIPESTTADSESVMFRHAFETGESQRYKIKRGMEYSYRGRALEYYVDLEVTEKCVGVSGGVYSIELTFDKVDGFSLVRDEMVPYEEVNGMEGQTISYSVNRRGRVENIRQETMVADWPTTKYFIQRIIHRWYAGFPNKECVKGETWVNANTDTTDGIIWTNDGANEFKGMKKKKGKKCARILHKSELVSKSLSGARPPTERYVRKMDYYVDAETCRLVKLKGNVEVIGMWFAGAGGRGDGNETLEIELKD